MGLDLASVHEGPGVKQNKRSTQVHMNCTGLDPAGSIKVLGHVYLVLPPTSGSSLFTLDRRSAVLGGRIVALCFFPFFLCLIKNYAWESS
jgi:hypothetical protein